MSIYNTTNQCFMHRKCYNCILIIFKSYIRLVIHFIRHSKQFAIIQDIISNGHATIVLNVLTNF